MPVLVMGFFLISPIHTQSSLNSSHVTHHASFTYKQSFYFNSNLPNLENQNGYYFPKGYGSFSSVLMNINLKHFSFSAEPVIVNQNGFSVDLPKKEKIFSVLNDVQYDNAYQPTQFRNTGIKINYNNLSAGLGNWNQWWGPGMHNSLVLSNNAEGFYHYFVGTNAYQTIVSNLSFKFKYMVSDKMENWAGDDYFYSAWFLNLRYKKIEFGMSRNVLSGGYSDLSWSLSDAMTVLVNHKNSKYWDAINEYYLLASFPESGLEIFVDIGFPNRSYEGQDPEVYSDHAMGSNLGLKKQGAFGSDHLLFGIEYTRLVQGIYYNILPTPNWYDNIKFNYSSYKSRRWAAHSGADSDDFLVFMGYKDEQKSFIYGLNYERHGVTYHYPPEVKFESRINASYKLGNTKIHLIYEDEYFEHYGFIDVNRNVWDETFEPGSLQRTHTLLISLEHTLSF